MSRNSCVKRSLIHAVHVCCTNFAESFLTNVNKTHLKFFIDFMTTFSELLEIDYPSNYNGEEIIPSPGISFLKALTNQETDVRK